jgi:hypothetical protein
MSGREAVKNLRERGMLPTPKDHGPTVRMVGLVLIAFVVGGGAVYGGAKLLSGGSRAVAPVETKQQVAVVAEIPTLTEAELERCGAAYRERFRSEYEDAEMAMMSGDFSAVAEGGAAPPMATEVICMAEIKPERLCDEEQRNLFVARVNEYLEQSMFLSAIAEATDFSTNVYIPVFTGVDHEGTDIINSMTEGARTRMANGHQQVAAELRRLVERGYMEEGDFGAFMGFGVPLIIQKMLKGVEPGPSACA